jgi:hypothetical protein
LLAGKYMGSFFFLIGLFFSSCFVSAADTQESLDILLVSKFDGAETIVDMEVTTVTEALDRIELSPSEIPGEDENPLPEVIIAGDYQEPEKVLEILPENIEKNIEQDINQNALEDNINDRPPKQCCCPIIQELLDALGTPKGAAIVGSIYSIALGISSIMWGFDWSKYLGTSESTKILLQEIGCFGTGIECIIFGVLIPVMLYEYNKNKINTREKNGDDNV